MYATGNLMTWNSSSPTVFPMIVFSGEHISGNTIFFPVTFLAWPFFWHYLFRKNLVISNVSNNIRWLSPTFDDTDNIQWLKHIQIDSRNIRRLRTDDFQQLPTTYTSDDLNTCTYSSDYGDFWRSFWRQHFTFSTGNKSKV